jgi:hypothetical protein
MHSTEYTDLAQIFDECGDVVMAFAPMNGSSNSIMIVGFNPDSDRYTLTHAIRMQHRDGTFMQWSWETRWDYNDSAEALIAFKKLI